MGKQDLVTMQQIAGINATNSWNKSSIPIAGIEDLRFAPTLSTFKIRLKTFVCFSFLLNLKYIALSKKLF
jgi:hypothetical protein